MEGKIIAWEVSVSGNRSEDTCLKCCPAYVPRPFVDCAIYSFANEMNTSGPPIYCFKCGVLILPAGVDWPG